MKKSFKILSLIAIGSSMVIGAVALSLSSAFSSFGSKFAKAVGNEYSVSFERADAHSASGKTYIYQEQTQNQNPIYLVSTEGASRSSGAIGTVPSTFDSTLGKIQLKFYKDVSMTNPFRHQGIVSITIKTSSSLELDIQTSPDGETFRSKGSLACTSSGATFSTFGEYDRFIMVTETSNSRSAAAKSITSVSLTYECENRSESFTSAVYSAVVKDKSNLDSDMSIHFNSDGYGYYAFFYNAESQYKHTLFKWTYDESSAVIVTEYIAEAAGSITGMVASGNSTSYQGYRLFARFNPGYYNYISLFDGKATVFFHTSQASTGEANKNQYQKAQFDVLTLN